MLKNSTNISCNICNNSSKELINLDCGHSFCSSCFKGKEEKIKNKEISELRGHSKNNNEVEDLNEKKANMTLNCLICEKNQTFIENSKKTEVAGNNININSKKTEVDDNNANAETDKEKEKKENIPLSLEMTCGDCKKKSAILKCLDCTRDKKNNNFCKPCDFVAHKFKSHFKLMLNLDGTFTSKCKECSKEEIKIGCFCNQFTKMPLCLTCMNGKKHKNHKKVELNDNQTINKNQTSNENKDLTNRSEEIEASLFKKEDVENLSSFSNIFFEFLLKLETFSLSLFSLFPREICLKLSFVIYKNLKNQGNFLTPFNEKKRTIVCWGSNEYGELGVGNYKENYSSPIEFKFNEKIKQIGCGKGFTLILTTIGDIYSFGNNKCGQLGLGKEIKLSNIPQKIGFPNTIKIDEIIAGYNHCFAISKFFDKNKNSVYCWGNNYRGQLGTPNEGDQYLPRIFSFHEKIKQIGCGEDFTLILTTIGDIYSFGYGYDGRLGLGKKTELFFTEFSTPEKIKFPNEIKIDEIIVGLSYCFAISKEIKEENNSTKIYCWGQHYSRTHYENYFSPIEFKFNEKIKQICCGDGFNLILTTIGDVYSFGNNKCGQLGLGKEIKLSNIPQKIGFPNTIKIDEIIAGYNHCFAISKFFDKNKNNAYCWGNNYLGQLGIGEENIKIEKDSLSDSTTKIIQNEYFPVIWKNKKFEGKKLFQVFTNSHSFHYFAVIEK